MASVETATILMTDLVGSTGLESRVGPAHAHELRAEYFSLLRAGIEDSGGREVKNTGDGLMLAFASPSAAVACAVAMQQRMERRNRSAAERLLVRIGISAGEATVEDGDYFGMPSIEAARLCEQAPGEGILASQLVRLMAASRGGEFEPVGALALKGIPEPVEAYSVTWAPLGAVAGAGLPLPTMVGSDPAVGFVGRERERTLIDDWSRDAREGSRRAIFLAGEPGIGKTRLATRAALEAHERGSVVCWGTAIEDLGAPYAAWIQALTHYVEHAPEEVLRAHVARHAGELSRLVRALGRRLPDTPAPQQSDPDTERFLLFTAVAGLLEEACEHAPMMLVLDDLQWADTQTLALMRHVIAASEHLPLLLIGTYRDSDLDRGHPLGPVLADMHRVPGVHRLALDGLRVQDVAAVMEGATGREMGEPGRALAQEIAQETAGNPFFVTEILRHLTESGAISEGEDGRWTLHSSIAELGLPQSVREVVVRRVRRLGELCEEALNVAAVVGRTFDVELLVRLGAGDEDELFEALDRAVASSLLTESPDRLGRFTFAHAIIDHTLYEALSANRRARLHRRVAEVLEELGDQDPDRLPELAYHWYAAGSATDPDRAIESARRAGEQALATLAPDEAMRWFEQALELLDRHRAPPDSGEAKAAMAARRAQLLLGLGSAQTRAGDGSARTTLLSAAQAARDAEDPAWLASVALSFGAFALSPGIVDEQLVSLLDEALAAVPEIDSALRVRLLTRLAVALYWSDTVARREALVEQAIAMARRLEDSEALAYALGHGQLATRTPDTTERGLAWIEELLRLAPRDRDLELAARSAQIDLLLEIDDMPGARAAVAALERMAAQLREPRAQAYAPLHLARQALIEGRYEDARRLNAQAAELGRRVLETAIPMLAAAQHFAMRWSAEGLQEMEATMRPYVESAPAMPAWRAGLALLYRDMERREDVRRELETLAARGFGALPRDNVWLLSMSLLSEVCAYLHDEDRAAEVYQLLEPFASRNVVSPSATFSGPVTRFLALLAGTRRQWDMAGRHFAAARQAAERQNARPVQAIIRLDEAVMLSSRGDPGDRERALELLEQGRQIAPEQMLLVLERIDVLAHELREGRSGQAAHTVTAR